jgi:hypothetical protein
MAAVREQVEYHFGCSTWNNFARYGAEQFQIPVSSRYIAQRTSHKTRRLKLPIRLFHVEQNPIPLSAQGLVDAGRMPVPRIRAWRARGASAARPAAISDG